MKRYNIINNSLGWLCFAIAAVTYLMTLEPTASFWDCPEFILQGYKQEVGHPPGNPIFVMTARLFINFAGGDVSSIAVAVNAMNAILSALTILFLFWTITHLVRRLVVPDGATEITPTRMAVIMGSGLCGALMYTWSDTFWFSAVEGEVYAFSSFCTALVFWLILKWENIADKPHSDRYLVLIAYIIGISIGVHLLNLLCIPAIGLVIYYRKAKDSTVRGSLLTLVVSALVIALILYGLMPGFIKLAGYFELFAVNTLGLGYNIGVLIYAVLFVLCSILCIRAIYRREEKAARILFMVMALMSGMLLIGSSVKLFILLDIPMIAALAYYLFVRKKVSMRLIALAALSILVIFIGYTSYALLLIRATANPAVNQNAPDNVFELKSYISREQYGETPLFYGPSYASAFEIDGDQIAADEGDPIYKQVAKASPDEPDRYVETPGRPSYHYVPNMLFPRMYSTLPEHVAGYKSWAGIDEDNYAVHEFDEEVYKDGRFSYYVETPTQADNIRYFLNYQFMHMYWRYFMWNFAGRQNDIQGNGEPNRGNWISGIPAIDDWRLGDQSLLPEEYGEKNAGHNVFYMLPLIMGLIGLVWQGLRDKRGIEQFWVVFFLFFMTGIAIVLYLNQVPNQPRERDYAFAGSFYAYAIWVGMGVAGIWAMIRRMMGVRGDADNAAASPEARKSLTAAAIACVVGLLVPVQVVSQTWDDHDRSGRYTTRDYGMNYLAGLDKDAIIFTNGDNDTFPLWYAQEVEGYRTDVRVINLSYLTTDWYADQMRIPSYDAPAVKFTAKSTDYAYDRLQSLGFDLRVNDLRTDYVLTHPDTVNIQAALRAVYDQPEQEPGKGIIPYPAMFIPSNVDAAVRAGVITPAEAQSAENRIFVDLYNDPVTCSTYEYVNDFGGTSYYTQHPNSVTLSQMLSLDLIANSVADGWSRPVYFSMTVPDSYYVSLSPYLFNTGLSYELTPLRNNAFSADLNNIKVNTDKMYRNVMNDFRWGGLDSDRKLYLDETVRRMVDTHRQTLTGLAEALIKEGAGIEDAGKVVFIGDTIAIEDTYSDKYYRPTRLDVPKKFAADRYSKAADILRLIDEKLPATQAPYSIRLRYDIAICWLNLGRLTGDKKYTDRGIEILEDEILRYGRFIPYFIDQQRRGTYNQLSGLDRYVPQYIYHMLMTYGDYADIDRLDALMKKNDIRINDLEKLLY